MDLRTEKNIKLLKVVDPDPALLNEMLSIEVCPHIFSGIACALDMKQGLYPYIIEYVED